MNKKMQPFVLQHQCLRFAAIAYEAAIGLGFVLEEKELPSFYSGALSEAASLLKDIVENLYYTQSDSINPHTVQVSNKSDSALWFYSLIRCHEMIYARMKTYEDILEAGEALEIIANNPSIKLEVDIKGTFEIQSFLFALCDAVTDEFHKEGIVGELDFSSFYEESKLSH